MMKRRQKKQERTSGLWNLFYQYFRPMKRIRALIFIVPISNGGQWLCIVDSYINCSNYYERTAYTEEDRDEMRDSRENKNLYSFDYFANHLLITEQIQSRRRTNKNPWLGDYMLIWSIRWYDADSIIIRESQETVEDGHVVCIVADFDDYWLVMNDRGDNPMNWYYLLEKRAVDEYHLLYK